MYVIKYKCYVGNLNILGNYFVLVLFWFEYLVKYSYDIFKKIW